MKNFKSFVAEAGPNLKPKAKGEADFVNAHKVEISDPEDQGTDGSAKVSTKEGSGKRKADKLDNKQAMGEEVEEIDEDAKETQKRASELADNLRKKDPEKSKVYRNLAVKASQRSYNPTGVSRGKGPIGQGNKAQRRLGKEPVPSPMSSDRMRGYYEEVELDEELMAYHKTKSSTGYDLYHKDFSSAMQHAYDFAKKKYNLEIDPKEIDNKVALGPKKPSKGKYNSYRLLDKTGKRAIEVQVANLDNKRYELNMYREEFELTEEEILRLDEAETPFTPDKPKKSPSAVAGKYGQGPSTAKHLAKQGMQKTLRQMKKSKNMQEADFTKQQTKMAHTIGKEFEKKGVGDETRGGPYAVASAMVRDKPEAAKKAYKTIQSKMKEETDAELLFKLYNDLNEENQEFFMHQLEEDADSLLEFARMMEEE